MERGEIGDMSKLGITESFKVKQQVLVSGAEAAEMILMFSLITYPFLFSIHRYGTR